MEAADRLAYRLPLHAIRRVCEQYPILELAVFGSALGDDFNETSDVDFLVDFEPEAPVGFLLLATTQEQLADALERPVDLVPKQGLKPLIRGAVLDSAQVVYAK